MRETGFYEKLGDLNYFTPFDLPPKNPEFQFSKEIMELYGEASFSLGRLNEMSKKLPDPTRFIKAYVIKEALLSSEIEGIHTTMIDVFTYPLDSGKIDKKTQLVFNYTKALNLTVNQVKDQNMPIVSRVILAAHRELMSAGEGDVSSPGQYRLQSVKVGNLIPPPAPKIENLIAGFERFVNDDASLPPLIKAGLAHVQFETIHPFLDGNGRIGRMLIVLMLIESGLVDSPILYPSLHFKKHQMEYYERLDKVRLKGDFEGWIHFYLKVIRDSSNDAYRRAKDIELLEGKIKATIEEDPKFNKMRDTAFSALNSLFQTPITNIGVLSKALDKTYNTASHILKLFAEIGIVVEGASEKRGKLFEFKPYIELLEKEYD